jgi:hypothetical protein
MSAHPLPGRVLRSNAREDDLVGPGDGQVLQKIWVYLVLRVLLAGLRLLVDQHQPHELHQLPHTMPPTSVALPLHVAGHSLTVRVFAKEISREVVGTHPTVSSGTACPLSGSCCA